MRKIIVLTTWIFFGGFYIDRESHSDMSAKSRYSYDSYGLNSRSTSHFGLDDQVPEKSYDFQRRRSSLFGFDDQEPKKSCDSKRRSSLFGLESYNFKRKRSSLFELESIGSERRKSSIFGLEEQIPKQSFELRRRGSSLIGFDDLVLKKIQSNNTIDEEFEIDDNESILILTKSQSQERINLLLVIWSLIFSVVILAYLTHFTMIILAKEPIVVQPNIKEDIQVGFPVPYLGILDENGAFHSMIPPFLNIQSQISVSLKRLPTRRFCGMYRGIIWPIVYKDSIYFINGDETKKIVKYNIKMDNHKTLAKSNISPSHVYRPSAVRIGNKFWFLGGHQVAPKEYDDEIVSGDYCGIVQQQTKLYNPSTSFWSLDREMWIDGPKIPKKPEFFGNIGGHVELDLSDDSTCLVAVNRSTVFLITSQNSEHFTSSYDVIENTWQSHTKAPVGIFESPSVCTMFITKHLRKFIFTSFWDTNTIGIENTVLSIFDIAKNQWTKTFAPVKGKGNLPLSKKY